MMMMMMEKVKPFHTFRIENIYKLFTRRKPTYDLH